jgi:hypothetical protein
MVRLAQFRCALYYSVHDGAVAEPSIQIQLDKAGMFVLYIGQRYARATSYRRWRGTTKQKARLEIGRLAFLGVARSHPIQVHGTVSRRAWQFWPIAVGSGHGKGQMVSTSAIPGCSKFYHGHVVSIVVARHCGRLCAQAHHVRSVGFVGGSGHNGCSVDVDIEGIAFRDSRMRRSKGGRMDRRFRSAVQGLSLKTIGSTSELDTLSTWMCNASNRGLAHIFVMDHVLEIESAGVVGSPRSLHRHATRQRLGALQVAAFLVSGRHP